jgi:hypothetical protein
MFDRPRASGGESCVTADLRQQLQASLEGRYTVERGLGRRVVIKLLSPDLSADVSARRFAREIRLAASPPQPEEDRNDEGRS